MMLMLNAKKMPGQGLGWIVGTCQIRWKFEICTF